MTSFPFDTPTSPMQSDALLAAIVHSSTDAIVSKNLESIVMSWNPAATRIFGFSADEMIGQSIRKIIPAHLQHEEDMILDRIRAGRLIEAYETTRLTASGGTIPISVTISPVHDADGRIIGASKIARDLRESRAMHERLHASEERFRLLADNISQLAWMAHPDGHIFWYNRRWYDYTGTTLAQAEGDGWRRVHHPDHVERVHAHFRQCCASGTEWEDVFPLRGTDGRYRWFLSRAIPARDEHGQIFCWFGTNTDITDERRHQDQIALLMREIQHRAKNMLSMIQALARRTAPADHPEFVESFEERLKALAANQELLVTGNWTGARMHELVRTQLYYVEDLIDGRIVSDGPDLLILPASAETIGMALHELVTNAAKYGALSNDSGKVEIRWDIEDSAHGREFVLSWREVDGPPVQEPDREGFGSTLITRAPRLSLNAQVESRFQPEGFFWRMRCDADRVLDGDTET